jgi:hypothetical protein
MSPPADIPEHSAIQILERRLGREAAVRIDGDD